MRKTRRTGPLLLAAVVARPNVTALGRASPQALVGLLQKFRDGIEEAARATGGNVVQYVASFALVAWRCEPGRAVSVDPIGTSRRLLEVVRGTMQSDAGSLVRVGMARGECSYEEQGGLVLSAMGHAWLRVARDFRPTFAEAGDATVFDRSLFDSLASDDRMEVGDGWYRAGALRTE
jgi:hypothetical protein